jgi:hypothetical protein
MMHERTDICSSRVDLFELPEKIEVVEFETPQVVCLIECRCGRTFSVELPLWKGIRPDLSGFHLVNAVWDEIVALNDPVFHEGWQMSPYFRAQLGLEDEIDLRSPGVLEMPTTSAVSSLPLESSEADWIGNWRFAA